MLSSDLSTNLKGEGGLEEKYQQVSMYLRCAKEFHNLIYRIHKTFDFDIRESYQNSYNCKHLRFNVNISFVTFLKHNLLTRSHVHAQKNDPKWN